jgi:hypothetical protein
MKKGSTLQFTILAITATIAVLIARRFLDRKSFQSLGLKLDRLALLDLLSGIVNSALLTTPQLIYAHQKTGQLWLPMGLHLGWNFFQASVFGFAASGQGSPSLISQTPTGPDWLSGGAFGAEHQGQPIIN